MHDVIEFVTNYWLVLCAILAVLAIRFKSLLLTILTLTAVAWYFREHLTALLNG